MRAEIRSQIEKLEGGAGEKIRIPLKITNQGTQAWPTDGDTPVIIGYHLLDEQWEVAVFDNPRMDLPKTVKPKEAVEVPFVITCPAPGEWLVEFDLLVEGKVWFKNEGSPTLRIPLSSLADRPLFRAGIEKSNKTPATLKCQPKEKVKIPLTLVNHGAKSWDADSDTLVQASYHLLDKTGAMIKFDNPRTAIPGVVNPGESTEIELEIESPSTQGNYQVEVDLVAEEIAWFKERGSFSLFMPLAVVDRI